MYYPQIMKKNVFLLAIAASLTFTACNNDDDNTPDPVNEEEVITTATLVLTPQGGGTPVTLQTRDIDGDGPGAPVITVSGDLMPNTTYVGAIVFLNETEDPAENVTLEVAEEDDEHQVFYIPGGGLNVTVTYQDADGDGNPLGLAITAETGDASTGTLNVVLRHEPNKPNDGTLGDAGGETDIEVTFDVTIQ